MRTLSLSIPCIFLMALIAATIGKSSNVAFASSLDFVAPTESTKVMLLCHEKLDGAQQPLANGFLPALITFEDSHATYKTFSSGSLATFYSEGIHPLGTRVSGFTWYEIHAESTDGSSLYFSLTYNNLANASGLGQLIVPGLTTKTFFISCTAIQGFL